MQTASPPTLFHTCTILSKTVGAEELHRAHVDANGLMCLARLRRAILVSMSGGTRKCQGLSWLRSDGCATAVLEANHAAYPCNFHCNSSVGRRAGNDLWGVLLFSLLVTLTGWQVENGQHTGICWSSLHQISLATILTWDCLPWQSLALTWQCCHCTTADKPS